MESDKILVNATGREYRKKRVEELGSALAQIRARVKATRGSGPKKDDEVEQSCGSKPPEDTERTALTKKILEEDRARFTKLQQNRVRMKEEYNQILIEREEQKKVEKQLQETIAKVTAPTPELPPLIKQRIIDLETLVENLKERVSEKDKVLSSKTQALTVLHNQLMQRSQEQVEKAMAFTQEISTIKEDFGKREELLKKEICRLKEREEELELRLSDKETHFNEFKTLQNALEDAKLELANFESRSEETTKALELTNKVNLKLKAQLKAMKIERDKLKQSLEGMEETEDLKNQIALLEEEKGNLQLQLVDFDDFKESYSNLESKTAQLEEELSVLRDSIKSLEQEKISLSNGLDSTSSKVKEQDNLIVSLRASLKEVEEHKISAEMRCIEIEEKMEILQNKTSSQLQQFTSEICNLQGQIDEKNSIIESLSNQLCLKEQEIFDIKGNNFPAEVESDSRLREIESYNSELVEKVRELQLESKEHESTVTQLNECLAERNETINNLKAKCDDFNSLVTSLKNNKSELENEIHTLKANEGGQRSGSQAKDNIEQKEDSNLKFKKLAANYKIKVKLCQELEEKLKHSNTVIDEKSAEIGALLFQLDRTKSVVEELREKETALNAELEGLKVKNVQLSKLVEDMAPKLEIMEAEKSSALHKAERMAKTLEELKKMKDGDSEILKEHILSVNSMASRVSLLEQELGNLQSILNEKNSVIEELETERKKLVEDMQNSEFELERLRNLYQKESVNNQNVLTNLQGLESEMLVSREEMNQIAEQLNSVTKNYNICLENLQDRENYIEALEEDIVGMKTKMYNLESGIGDRHRLLEERGNQLSVRLEEAEIITQTFDKYQAEMDNKFKIMEDNENAMKSNISHLKAEIDKLNALNQELHLKNKSSDKQVTDMLEEINTLRDVKNSYNMTLDRIEILNEELKHVMCDFESKNQELIRLGEERTELINKLSDLEDSYSDLKTQLRESEEKFQKLNCELEMKSNALENALLEIKSLKKEINDTNLQQKSDGPPGEIKVFSWDQHSHQPQASSLDFTPSLENDSLKIELNEKKKFLSDAQQTISDLQSEIASSISQKDAEISSLKEDLSRLIHDYSNLKNSIPYQTVSPEGSVTVFSWPSQQKAGINTANEELDESRKRLELAELQICNLKKTIDSLTPSHKDEMNVLGAEIHKISSEKPGIEKSLTLNHGDDDGNMNEVQMFSWSDHDHGSDKNECSNKLELEEMSRSLEVAQLEIINLQAALSKVLNEKDSEISSLKGVVSRLTHEKEDLERIVSAEQKNIADNRSDELKIFSWGQQNQEVGKDEEDGWGWIGAEAHLEEDHKHSEALQIQSLTQRVSELLEEKNALNEKLNASKIKCVKLVKKIKEIEAVQEQHRTERNVGFSDLDFALQEELRSQLDQLETKSSELNSELSNLKLEKEHLNKRIDVLTSANEQLIEMKERQDIEVQMWQKRSVELKNEVQALQWSLEEVKSEIPEMNKGEAELSNELNILAAENEKLQSIICDLKDGLPVGNGNVAAELNLLKEEFKKLKELRNKDKELFDNEIRKANEELDSMEIQLDSLLKENKTLKDRLNDINNSNQDIAKLNEQIEKLTESNKHYEKTLLDSSSSSDIESRVEVLVSENTVVKKQISCLNEVGSELDILNDQLELLTKENSKLKLQIDSYENAKQDSNSLLDKIQQLGIENANLKEKLVFIENSKPDNEGNETDLLRQKLDYLTAELNLLKNEFEKVSSLNQQLKKELSDTKESNELNLRIYTEKSEKKLKDIAEELKRAMVELDEFDFLISESVVKYNISVLSTSKVDKLKQVLLCIDNILSEKIKLLQEVENLKDQLSNTRREPTTLHLVSTPPVFKGFSSFTNDPFDNIQSNQQGFENEKLNIEISELRSIIDTYELELARLNSDKATNEQIITDLKTEISSMNELVAKLNLQRSSLSDDVRIKLERADLEVNRWKDEATNLRCEINNLIEKHSQEIHDLRKSDAGSKEKLSEIEENYQNTMLNKDQESGYLKQILSEKEQLLANAINERNALHSQFETLSQQFFSLEARGRELTRENEELQGAINQSRREGNTVIEKQKEEIHELKVKLDYMNHSQNLRNSENENEKLLKKQIQDISSSLSYFEQSTTELQSKVASQSEEISRLHLNVSDLENQRLYLESIISDKQKEIDSLQFEQPKVQQSVPVVVNNDTDIKLAGLIKEKDLEIARISKVLHDTQERLVQVQDSKPIDKVMTLQAKLDQSLYNVHGLNVKCDELTREIIQLLGERDTLQFRLSECLRENELLKGKGASESSSTSSPEIKEKLGELHKFYKKDPALQQDMETRHNRQMDLYTEEKEENTTVDFGIFNWFFSSPSSPSQPKS